MFLEHNGVAGKDEGANQVTVDCSWDEAASVLCDSVIGEIHHRAIYDVYCCYNDVLGDIDIFLSVSGASVLIGDITVEKLRLWKESKSESVESLGIPKHATESRRASNIVYLRMAG